jgi:hypothetical protein
MDQQKRHCVAALPDRSSAMTAALTLPDEYKVLVEHDRLSGYIVAEASPLPLVLHDIGFILPIDRVKRHKAGELPIHLRRRVFRHRSATGKVYTVNVAGDSFLGLPYGNDWKVWLGVLRWVDEEGVDAEGWLRGVSGRRLLDAMGLPYGGRVLASALDGLERLAHTQITSRLVYVPEQFALELKGRPMAPGSIDYARLAEELDQPAENRVITDTVSLLQVTIDRPRARTSSSAGRLLRLWVNPQILHHASIGWTTWINVPAHAQLKGVVAMRLYHMLAAAMSEGRSSPLTISLRELVRLLSLDEQPGAKGPAPEARVAQVDPHMRPVRIRRQVEEAFPSLVAQGVVERWEAIPGGSGRKQDLSYRIYPGRLIRAARNLRGCGLRDTPENRVLIQALQFYGLPLPLAREWVAEDQAAALENVHYVLYSHTAERAKPVENPASFLRWAKEQKSRQTALDFQRWLRTAVGRLQEGVPPERAQLQIPGVVVGGGAPPADVPSDAWVLFQAMREHVRAIPGAQASPLRNYMAPQGDGVLLLAPVRIEDSTLWLRPASEFIRDRVAPHHPTLLTAASLFTEGRVTAIEYEIP